MPPSSLAEPLPSQSDAASSDSESEYTTTAFLFLIGACLDLGTETLLAAGAVAASSASGSST